MDKLEELLENFLLLIGGTGLMAILKLILHFPRHFQKLNETLKPLLNNLALGINEKMTKSK